MDSVLEKITLYDILGYLFPGCILVMMILTAYKDWALQVVVGMGENTGILYFAFFLISYLMGTAVSEAGALILWTGRRAITFIARKCRWIRFRKNDLWKEQMIKALKKSGICNNESEIRNNLSKDSGYYKTYIYSIAQSSAEYKRIHNYKSACVMYKNMIFSLIGGNIIMYLCGAANNYIYTVSIVICLLFIRRYNRFAAKTEEYAVACFIDKYR